MISNAQATAFLNELESVLDRSSDRVAAALQLIASRFDHYQWIGVYWLEGTTLVLGPYVGPHTEHDRIEIGQGVCGTAIAEDTNLIVHDVRNVENYLACSLTTRSEIVVLIRRGGEVIGQIDADGDEVGAFDRSDEALLTVVAERLSSLN